MKSVYHVYKPQGATPLSMAHRLRSHEHIPVSVRIGYAGRLDPMADGVLLLLTGDENKKKARYEDMPKTYTVRIVFGLSTDTYDLLGLVTGHRDPIEITRDAVASYIEAMPKTYDQPYPPYSSKTVHGIPLYRYARTNTLSEITIPVKKITIHTIGITHYEAVSAHGLLVDIRTRIGNVSGNFRQEKIMGMWESTLAQQTEDRMYPRITISCTASSGTYMRSLAHSMGVSLGTGAIAETISRTAIGPFTLADAVQLHT